MTRAIYVGISLLASLVCTAAAISSEPTGLPTDYSNDNDYHIRYDDLDLILSASVLEVGRSDRRAASRSLTKNSASRIRHGNTSVTAFEGNRLIFHEFKQEHIESLIAIRQDIEAVPDFIPLEEFTKNEQLAYWLNLHNVAVIIEVAKEYPIKRIKKLAVGRQSVWDQKTMNIAGIPTSIRDIERHVVANWNTPLVLYGFFMGTIGGPNIRDQAYTRQNVVEMLTSNAKDFVNSLRGFRSWSGRGRVSSHYKLGLKYFPDFDQDIRKHLEDYADSKTLCILEQATLPVYSKACRSR